MRDVNNLPGIHKARTMLSAKKRSMPRIQSSAYLDLYMLNKEKERLLKESERVCIRDTGIKKRLEEIDVEVNKLRETEMANKASFSECTFTQKDGAKKEWKKKTLKY
ncbi:hypothetical protein KKE26_02385 [bacterium]|nr:hypothetical protein [bacterium]MBU1753874.1 hypothetical protein [bacterium]